MNTPVTVPLLDLKAQYVPLREEIRAALDRVCDSQHFILGPEVSALEAEVAAFSGAAFGVGMSSGTDALLAALMALDVRAGDEVVTTPYSFFATAGVVARLGARPVFVDVDPESLNIDVRLLRRAVTPRTKAVVPVHLFGRCVEMGPLLEAAGGVPIVEDAAQAVGAKDAAGRLAGSSGLMGCLSFFPSKNLGAFGDGGMVLTNDAATAERLRILRVHGSQPKYYHRIVGGNFRLDALQAAVLRVKLKHLAGWSRKRRENADRYRRLLAGIKEIVLPADVPGHIYNQFVIRAPRRNELQAHLVKAGIGTEVYYPVPLHLQECFAGLGHKAGDFPHAERAAQETLALPIYPELSEAQQQAVASALSAFYR